VFEAGGQVIFNGNDNNPTLEAAHELRQRHGDITCALLKYNAASPYPACFLNLGDAGRLQEAERIRRRNLEHFTEVTRIMRPEYVMPFAGSFVLAGKQCTKDRYLGVMSWDTVGKYVQAQLPRQKVLLLREGMTFDFSRDEILGATYQPVDFTGRESYASSLMGVPYSFDNDCLDESWICTNLPRARQHLWNAQQRFGFVSKWAIHVRVGDSYFAFSLDDSVSRFVPLSTVPKAPFIRCSMDLRLLQRILRREAHWNNAEIGCHIDFWREPNEYHPDIHVLLSFFHLPVEEQRA